MNTTTDDVTPTKEELLKAYRAQQNKNKYNAEYMKKYRKENREEWNKKQRERYAQKKTQGA
jgi:hypothetical protein